jgi:hypothetical protein
MGMSLALETLSNEQRAAFRRYIGAGDVATLQALTQRAEDAANSAAAASNYYPSLAAGEAATAVGQFFSHPDGVGGLVYRERTAGGSTVIGNALTNVLEERRAEQDAVIAGEADSRAKLIASLVNLRALGGGRLRLTPAKTYNLSAAPQTNLGGAADIPANAGHLLIPPADDVHFDGNGGYVRSTAPAQALIRVEAEILRTSVVTGPMAAGARTFALSAAGEHAHYAAGDTVQWRIGDVPGDTPETPNTGFARVASVNAGANTVTLDRGLDRAWDGTGVDNKHLIKLQTARGQVLDNLRCKGLSLNGTPEIALLTLTRQIGTCIPFMHVKGGARSGGGYDYNENLEFGRVILEDIADVGGDPNTGLGLRFAGSTARIASMSARNLYRHALSVEAGSRVAVDYLEDFNYGDNPDRIVAVAGYASRLHIERSLYRGAGAKLYSDTATSRITYGTVRGEWSSDPLVLPVPGRNADEVSFSLNGVEELYRADQVYDREFFIDFVDGLDQEYNLPWGICAGCVVTLHGNATAADFVNFDVGHQFAKNNIKPVLTAIGGVYEQDVWSAAYAGFGSLAGSNWTQRRNSGVAFYIKLPASGMTGSGKAVSVRMLVVPDLIRSGVTSYLDTADVRKWNGV